MREKRAEFQRAIAALQVQNLVFIDESGVDTRLVRRYGRAAPGERACGSAPFGRNARLTIVIVAGLCLEGLLTPMSSTVAINTDLFLGYMDQVLIPELMEKKPNAIVVLDNPKPHRAAVVREKLEAAGLRLRYLPPYSPDFAPIEQAWSKFKTLLRSVAATREALERALAQGLNQITTADAHGWFAHCGYNATLN